MVDSRTLPAVLITGASRGIGLALACRFASLGHLVYATCRDPGAATDLISRARDNPLLRIEQLDAGNEDDISRVFQTCTDPAPRIIICNAVQAQRERSFRDLDSAGWERSVRVNALSMLLFAQHFAAALEGRPGAAIIAIGSTMGVTDLSDGPGKLTYRSSKAALHMLVKGLAEELPPIGIRCYAIHPGWVLTGLGGQDAPLCPHEAARDIVQLVLAPPAEIDGRLVDRSGKVLA